MYKFVLLTLTSLVLTSCSSDDNSTDNPQSPEAAFPTSFVNSEPRVQLEPSTQYEWSVRARTVLGDGLWSEALEFSIHESEELALADAITKFDSYDYDPSLFSDALPIPTVVADTPVGSITNSKPTFEWGSVADALEYEIRIINVDTDEEIFSDSFSAIEFCADGDCGVSSETAFETTPLVAAAVPTTSSPQEQINPFELAPTASPATQEPTDSSTQEPIASTTTQASTESSTQESTESSTTPEPTESPTTQEPTDTSTQEPIESSTTQEPTDSSTGEPAESSTTQEPTDSSTQEPTESSTTQEPTDSSTGEPTESPTEETTDSSTQEPMESSTEEPSDSFAQEPTESSTQETTDSSTPELGGASSQSTEGGEISEIESLQQSEGVLAFPGALGYAKNAVGGRSGRVVIVNTVNDVVDSSDNFTSLREAVEVESGPRTIVFSVGGIFDTSETLLDFLGEADSNVTVACQTAPSPGVIIRTWGLGVQNAHDLIFRHCTVRGVDVGARKSESGRGVTIRGGSSNVVFDHISFSWATDEGFQVYLDNNQTVPIENVTLSNSIVAEGDADSSHKLSVQYPHWGYHAMGSLLQQPTPRIYHYQTALLSTTSLLITLLVTL